MIKKTFKSPASKKGTNENAVEARIIEQSQVFFLPILFDIKFPKGRAIIHAKKYRIKINPEELFS